jgi:hypothetical protein
MEKGELLFAGQDLLTTEAQRHREAKKPIKHDKSKPQCGGGGRFFIPRAQRWPQPRWG